VCLTLLLQLLAAQGVLAAALAAAPAAAGHALCGRHLQQQQQTVAVMDGNQKHAVLLQQHLLQQASYCVHNICSNSRKAERWQRLCRVIKGMQ
jgi:hypothetical protein